MSDDQIIEVVQAHKEGKKIEYSWGGKVSWYGFDENPDHQWNFAKYTYRVAPEPRKPRELWVCNGRDRSHWLIVPESHNPRDCGGEMIHLREVLE